MLLLIGLLYLILPEFVKNDDIVSRIHKLDLKKTEILNKLKMDVNYYLPTGESITAEESKFDTSNIIYLNFTVDGSEMRLEFQKSDRQHSRLIIQCRTSQNGTEIEISECKLYIRGGNDKTTGNYSIGYQYRFNTITNYEFEKHKLQFNIDENKNKYFRFRLTELIILFRNTSRRCVFKNEAFKNKDAYLNTKLLVYPCETDGRNYSSVIDITNSNNFDEFLITTKNQLLHQTGVWTTIYEIAKYILVNDAIFYIKCVCL
ncbi:hypothetical protein RF11_14341 [Thelohanellus kitauei]|uniref:Uncharacterized protein n=1 Tax=Thelohanellus kitauei TaxID=669202 RepID=A0A0C2I9U5_THEKT|nr:hypothetical protein RF11_14341 [Thelohanellus kitauei]